MTDVSELRKVKSLTLTNTAAARRPLQFIIIHTSDIIAVGIFIVIYKTCNR